MTFLAVLYLHIILQVLEGWRERSTSLNFEDSIALDVLALIWAITGGKFLSG